jgi:hypothetical protein
MRNLHGVRTIAVFQIATFEEKKRLPRRSAIDANDFTLPQLGALKMFTCTRIHPPVLWNEHFGTNE